MRRILIIDDDRALSEVMNALLFEAGFTVDTAISCQQARKMVDMTDYALAFVDFRLPDGRGDELIKYFQAMVPDMRCVALTGITDDGIERVFVDFDGQEGVSDRIEIMRKPADVVRIADIAAKYLQE